MNTNETIVFWGCIINASVYTAAGIRFVPLFWLALAAFVFVKSRRSR